MPLLPPLQLAFVLLIVAFRTDGCVIVTEFVLVHPEASVTVTLYVFAAKLPIVAVVAPVDQ